MAAGILPNNPRYRKSLAGELIARYGRVHARLGVGLAPKAIDAKLSVHLIGKFSGATMARYLWALGIVPATQVAVNVKRRNWTQRSGGKPYRINGVRPEIRLEWKGSDAESLFDLVGWDVKDSPKLRAWARWQKYRGASRGESSLN